VEVKERVRLNKYAVAAVETSNCNVNIGKIWGKC
jgi:hypothetical protein